MTKAELIHAAAKKTGMKIKDAEALTEAVFETMTEALQGGEKVTVAGFGSFSAKDRCGYLGRNPYTGEEMQIGACRRVTFTPGKNLRGGGESTEKGENGHET